MEANSLLELAYNDYINAHQREALTRSSKNDHNDCGIEIYNNVIHRLLVMKHKIWLRD